MISTNDGVRLILTRIKHIVFARARRRWSKIC